MSRVKSFDSTGVPPAGRLYAGDLNAIQDHYIDLYDLTQNAGVGAIAVGEAGLAISRYGVLDMRVSGALRTDGIFRGLGGLIAGAFTTAQRDAIPVGYAPYGLQILNTTTNRYEFNNGTDAARNWASMGGGSQSGASGVRPPASASNAGQFFYATDKDVLYQSNGSAWVRVGSQPGDLFFTMNAAARTGRVLAQGQTVARTGIYDELFALWGTQFNVGGEAGTDFRLPDWQARSPVMVGTDVYVNGIGKNEGVALAYRRGTKHRHTPHAHTSIPALTQAFAPGGNFAAGGANGTTGIADGGSGVATDPLDGGAFIVCNVEIKL